MSTKLEKNHWTRSAKCNLDAKLLSNHPDDIAEMKALCAVCPVQVECIKWTAEIDGHNVSAGMTYLERRMMQWKRVSSENESSFRDSSIYVSTVERRVRQAIYS